MALFGCAQKSRPAILRKKKAGSMERFAKDLMLIWYERATSVKGKIVSRLFISPPIQ